MECKRFSLDDLSRHVPIYRNGNFRKMRPQFRKLHFRNWKRNNEQLTMLSKTAKLGYLCWNRIKWCRFWDTDITVGIDVHKKEKFIQFLSSKRQKRGFSVDVNVQLNSRCKFWNNIFFRVSSFCTNCLRTLIISFQNTNRKWSGTRLFIHPGVKQNVPEWLIW